MPKMNNNILPQLKSKETKNEKIISDYFNTYQGSSFYTSQKKLAEKLKISEATISRYAKKLKFNSYKELSIWFNQGLRTFNENYKFKKSDRGEFTIDNIIISYKYIFDQLTSSIDMEEIKKISHKIKKSKRVIIFGLGSSSKAADELANNLLRLGYNANSPSEFHSLLPLMNSDEDIFFIFISNNFQNKEIIWSVNNIKNPENVALITSKKLNPVEESWINYKITYNKINNDFFGVPLSNKQGQWMIIDIIMITIYKITSDKNVDFFRKGMFNIKKWENSQ